MCAKLNLDLFAGILIEQSISQAWAVGVRGEWFLPYSKSKTVLLQQMGGEA